MSFNSSPSPQNVFPTSNHSLYTPSYSVSALAPIKCQELDLEPSLPISAPKVLKSVSVSVRETETSKSNPKSRDPVQYQKLKMSYLRRLNVIPIISQKDVRAALGDKENPTKDLSNRKQKKYHRDKVKPSPSDSDGESCAMKRFIPSFLPSNGLSSLPIPIPPRVKKLSQSALSLEDLEKGNIIEPSSLAPFKPASLIPDHFGVFFPDFEL
jgi:hypothetical protein